MVIQTSLKKVKVPKTLKKNNNGYLKHLEKYLKNKILWYKYRTKPRL